MVFQTQRLILREFSQADSADLAETLQDPEDMYAYGHSFTASDVQAWLDRQRLRYEKYGFGLWAAVLQTSGEIVGQAGLTLQPCEGETLLEIGYLLKRRFWGRGYAKRMPLNGWARRRCFPLLKWRISPPSVWRCRSACARIRMRRRICCFPFREEQKRSARCAYRKKKIR